MNIKPLKWQKDGQIETVIFMGLTLSVFPNNGKWDARLINQHQRPETETGFETAEEAKKYAEKVLLMREIKKHFTMYKGNYMTDTFHIKPPEFEQHGTDYILKCSNQIQIDIVLSIVDLETYYVMYGIQRVAKKLTLDEAKKIATELYYDSIKKFLIPAD